MLVDSLLVGQRLKVRASRLGHPRALKVDLMEVSNAGHEDVGPHAGGMRVLGVLAAFCGLRNVWRALKTVEATAQPTTTAGCSRKIRNASSTVLVQPILIRLRGSVWHSRFGAGILSGVGSGVRVPMDARVAYHQALARDGSFRDIKRRLGRSQEMPIDRAARSLD